MSGVFGWLCGKINHTAMDILFFFRTLPPVDPEPVGSPGKPSIPPFCFSSILGFAFVAGSKMSIINHIHSLCIVSCPDGCTALSSELFGFCFFLPSDFMGTGDPCAFSVRFQVLTVSACVPSVKPQAMVSHGTLIVCAAASSSPLFQVSVSWIPVGCLYTISI